MNELNLIVKENIAGKLDTNIEELAKFVTERLQDYTPEKYDGDAASAKKARAELNNAKKQIGQSRIALMAELMKPYNDFEKKCKDLEKLIDEASKQLDIIVKAKENEEKEAKKKLIETIFAEKKCTVITLDKIFDSKWLNKSTKLTDVSVEIDNIIQKVYKDLQTIESFDPENSDMIKSKYLEDLNLSNALTWAENFKINQIKVAKEAEEREERIHNENIQQQKVELAQEQKDFVKTSGMSSLVADALETEIEVKPVEYIISFSATESQMLGIKNYLTQQGIEIHSCEEASF